MKKKSKRIFVRFFVRSFFFSFFFSASVDLDPSLLLFVFSLSPSRNGNKEETSDLLTK